jgi:hypothetical protein
LVQNWGEGDTGYSGVFLGISAHLEHEGVPCKSWLELQASAPGESGPWKCKPPAGSTATYDSLERCVSGVFGKFNDPLNLRPVGK